MNFSAHLPCRQHSIFTTEFPISLFVVVGFFFFGGGIFLLLLLLLFVFGGGAF